MDEDEEVVLKNTGLYTHLSEAGFDNFEVMEEEKIPTGICNMDNENFSNILEIDVTAEDLKKEFEYFVDTILNSNLVFHDDAIIIQNCKVHFQHQAPRTSLIRSKHFKLITKTAIVSAVCLMCSVKIWKMKPFIYVLLHSIPVGIYCVEYAYVMYNKRKRNKCIINLIRNMKDLSMIIQKSVQYIQEYEIMMFNNLQNKIKSSSFLPNLENNKTPCRILDNLRKSVYSAIRSSILTFKNLVITLIDCFPLKKTAEFINFHLAILDENELRCSCAENSSSVQELQKMKYVYLLLQSEFLRQLCLCFTPSMWRDTQKNIPQRLFTIVTNLNKQCLELYNELKSVFNIYYTFEKIDGGRGRPKSNRKWIYKDAYIKLCSLSLNLQSVLRDCRNLEEYFEQMRLNNANNDDEVVQKLNQVSEDLSKNYDRCKITLHDFRKYVVNLKSKGTANKNVLTSPMKNGKPSINKTNVLLGITDFNSYWPDEVFVGISTEEQKVEKDTNNLDLFSNIKCPGLLINELKIALQNKKQEWKERERVALKNKCLNDDVEDEALFYDEKIKEAADVTTINQTYYDSDEIENSDSERLIDNTRKFELNVAILNSGSFAEQIASASVQWNLQTEEYFDEDNDDTSSSG